MAETMRAARIHEFGGPEVLRLDRVEVPRPGRGELLIRVAASGVNPVDWRFREGHLQKLVPRHLPATIGWDVAGTIEAVGTDVVGWTVGEAVIARPDPSAGGTWADFVAIDAGEVARKPRNISLNEAAALPLAGLTARAVLIGQGGLRAGERVLILGGSGGVGHLAIQIAKAQGAWVAATASAKNADFVRSLGADEVTAYDRPSTITSSDIDFIADLVGPAALSVATPRLRAGGRIRSIVAPPQLEPEHIARGLDGAFVYAPPSGGVLGLLAELVDQGKLRPTLRRVFSLDQVAEALHEMQHGSVIGKAVIQISPES